MNDILTLICCLPHQVSTWKENWKYVTEILVKYLQYQKRLSIYGRKFFLYEVGCLKYMRIEILKPS